jgi:hypothetical protein
MRMLEFEFFETSNWDVSLQQYFAPFRLVESKGVKVLAE